MSDTIITPEDKVLLYDEALKGILRKLNESDVEGLEDILATLEARVNAAGA